MSFLVLGLAFYLGAGYLGQLRALNLNLGLLLVGTLLLVVVAGVVGAVWPIRQDFQRCVVHLREGR